mmetsp:Transcript_6309/g.9821  ORF Transcript_6309/g.9821 Transcript_6309/m.9821 type:complete len:124 (-) Transcript_6309:701-1072(-)
MSGRYRGVPSEEIPTQFNFVGEVQHVAGIVPPMSVPFNRKSAKSILRYSEAFSALITLWIISCTNYKTLPASSNVMLIQASGVSFVFVAYIFDALNFQGRYWEIWPIMELSIDTLLTLVTLSR